MNAKHFGEQSPGKLVSIPFVLPSGEATTDHAFVPDRLPPSWSQSTCWELIVEAAEAVKYLDGVGRNLPNPSLFLRPLGDREAIQSSRLEGTFSTAREALLFDIREGDVAGSDEKRDDWREVTNYAKALNYGIEYEGPLSLYLVRTLHQFLLRDVTRGKDKKPGEFRNGPVGIGDRRNPRFIPPPEDSLQDCLDDFETAIQSKWTGYHPIVSCLIAHYQFETIHPFFDGNGRIGRLLLSLMLWRHCELAQPWLYLSEYFEEHREEYIDRLYNVSTKGDWDGWVQFGLRATRDQARVTADRCERLLAVQRQWMDRMGGLNVGVGIQAIASHLFKSSFIDASKAEEIAGVSNPTARKYLKELVSLGILAELQGVYPLTYFAPEIYDVVYADLD